MDKNSLESIDILQSIKYSNSNSLIQQVYCLATNHKTKTLYICGKKSKFIFVIDYDTKTFIGNHFSLISQLNHILNYLIYMFKQISLTNNKLKIYITYINVDCTINNRIINQNF